MVRIRYGLSPNLIRHMSRFAERPGIGTRAVGRWALRAAKHSAPGRAVEMTAKGNLIMVPMIAFMAAASPRGERAATLASETAGVMAMPFFAAAASLLIPGGPMLGAGTRAFLATFAASVPDLWLTERANRAFSHLSHSEQRIMRAQMGGNYDDTDTAQAFRFRAAQDMSSAFQASRTWLGREAFFLRH